MCRIWIEVRFVHCDHGLDPELTPEGMAMAMLSLRLTAKLNGSGQFSLL